MSIEKTYTAIPSEVGHECKKLKFHQYSLVFMKPYYLGIRKNKFGVYSLLPHDIQLFYNGHVALYWQPKNASFMMYIT